MEVRVPTVNILYCTSMCLIFLNQYFLRTRYCIITFCLYSSNVNSCMSSCDFFASLIGVIKTESDEMEDNEQYLMTETERSIGPKEEAEGVSEDGMEEGVDEERTEEDDDEEAEEDGDTLNEPQDLSLADYSRYDGATLPDTHPASEAAGDSCMSGAVATRIQAPGKLNCDICGLSCVSINVLLVHKRSHTGRHGNAGQTQHCAIITLLIALGDRTCY